jgi:hypothetical protein
MPRKNLLILSLLGISAGLAGASLQAQVIIPTDFALPASAADTSKPGFFWNVSEVLAIEPNQLSWAESQLAGLEGQNFADPNAVGEDAAGPAAPANPVGAPISFVIPTSINFSIVDHDTTHGSTNLPGVTEMHQMPGLPGTGGNNGTDNTAAEVLTYLNLPSGTNTMGVRSDDGFRLTIGGASPSDKYSPQATVVGSFNGGRGAADSIFHFVIQQPGLYAARMIYENGGGDANVQFFTVNGDGTYSLVNDTVNGGINSYRAVTVRASAYASSLVPLPGSTGISPQPTITAVLNDGTTPLDQTQVTLSLNGTPVTPTFSRSGSQLTVSFIPATLLASGTKETVSVTYVDGTNPRTNTWSFTTGFYTTLVAAQAVAPATNKPGFKFNIFANSVNDDQVTFNNDYRDFAEQSLNMVYHDWSDQTIPTLPLLINQANPASIGSAIGAAPALAVSNAPAEFEISGTIDFNGATTPGLPANDASLDRANGELLTYVSVPAGLTTFGITSSDLYRVYFGSWDATLGQLGGHLNVYGSVDTTFFVVANTAGVYPMRLIWNHATVTDPSLRIYTIDSKGNQHALNDTANGGLAVYRALAAPSEPYIKFTSPNTMLHQMCYPTYAVVANIADGDIGVDDTSPALTLDGAAVPITKSRFGDVLMVTYNPTTLQVPTELHTATLAFKDKGGKQLSETWSFMNLKSIWLPANPVAGENFDSYPGDGTVFNSPPDTFSTNWNNPFQPSGSSWYAFGYTYREANGEDLTNPTSDSYYTWVVCPLSTFANIEGDVVNVLPLETLNGQPVTSLGANNIFVAESDNRNGSTTGGQEQWAYSKAFDLSNVTNPVVAWSSLYKQNQDSITSIEYSVDGGTNWAPVIYFLDGSSYKSDPPDVFLALDATVDAVTTLTIPQGDVPVWTDYFGNVKGGNYGDCIATPITQALSPFIAPRVNDNHYSGHTVEAVRLPLASKKKDVRLRIGQLGTCSWYSAVDNIGFYDIAPSGATVPTGIVTTAPPMTFHLSPDGKTLTLTYTGSRLESASSINGPWNTVPGASSPYPAPVAPSGNAFYRAR